VAVTAKGAEAGVPGSAHGVRKIAATRAANAGATVAQLHRLARQSLAISRARVERRHLEAIFGWTGGTLFPHLSAGEGERAKTAIKSK
jgi:hypothetical protein